MQKQAADLNQQAAREAASGNAGRAAELKSQAENLSSAAEGKMEEGFRHTSHVDANAASLIRGISTAPSG